MRNDFTPSPGRFGTHPLVQGVAFPTLPNTGTIRVALPIPKKSCLFDRAVINQFGLGTHGSTATVTIVKTDSGNSNADLSLTAAVDLTSATQTAKVPYAIVALTSLTDTQLMLHDGDGLYAVFTTGGTTSAQPTAASVTAELFLLK